MSTSNVPNQSWTRLLDSGSFSETAALTVGNDGVIYVGGQTVDIADGNNIGGYGVAFLTKFNIDGSKSWTRLLDSGGSAGATSLATAPDGAIYMAGSSLGGIGELNSLGSRDAFIVKYNADGTNGWARLFGTSTSDESKAVTAAKDGAVYVAGSTEGNLNGQTVKGGRDAFLVKLNSDGTDAWTRLFGTSALDEARAITTGTDGSIYVAGITLGGLDGQVYKGYGDAFITKYRPDGTREWTRILGSDAWDEVSAITSGVDGSIYLAGYTEGNLDGQPNSGNGDAFLSKYNADGTKVWTKLLGTSARDGAHALTAGKDGSIYLAGETQGNLDGQNVRGYSDAFIIKFSPNEVKAWTRLLGTTSTDRAFDLASGKDDAIFVVGETQGNLDGQSNLRGADLFLQVVVGAGASVLPMIRFATTSSSGNEGNVGNVPIAVEAVLSGITTQPVTLTVSYSGTATLGSDYTNAVSTITIPAGNASGSLTFLVSGDTAVEPTETVILTMGTPTNATLGTNTTYTHTIVNDDTSSTSALTSGIFLSPSGYIGLGSALINVYGSTAQETVVLNAGSSKVVLDQNVDRLYLGEAPGAYRFQQSGISLNGYAANGTDPVFSVALQNDADGTVLVFPGGSASATVGTGGMRLGYQAISASVPTAISPGLSAYAAPPTGPSGASVFLGQGANFTAASTDLSLYGAAGSESVALARGVSGVVVDQLVERVQFDGLATAGLKFQQQGIGLVVYEGTTLLARVPLQNDTDGTLITTADGTMQAKVSAAGMRLGGALVSPTAPGAVVPTEVDTSIKAPSASLNTSITGAGTSNAATGDKTFTLAPITSSYTYTITGFGAGDRIISPIGALVSIAEQTSFTDGSLSLQYASGGNIVKITLTGLMADQDGRIFSISDLNTVFGPGSFT